MFFGLKSDRLINGHGGSQSQKHILKNTKIKMNYYFNLCIKIEITVNYIRRKRMNLLASNTSVEYSQRLYLFVLYVFLAIGTVMGGLFLVNRYGNSTDIKNWIDMYLLQIQAGIDKNNIFMNSIKNSVFTLIIFFICSFFRCGPLIISAEIVRRGFVTGFTAAAFMKYYGIKGMVLIISLLPHIIILLPAGLIYASVGCAFALKKIEREKKYIIFYIFFSILILAIFCISSIFEGFLSTIFMKWVTNSVT